MGKELVFSESKFSDYCALFFVLFILFNEVVIFYFGHNSYSNSTRFAFGFGDLKSRGLKNHFLYKLIDMNFSNYDRF